MVYTPENWVNNAPPAIDAAVLTKIENGIANADNGLSELEELFHTASSPEYTYFVSPSFDSDIDLHRFNSINEANEYVYANLPPYPIKATIFIYPGVYTESIENSFYRIHLVGTAATSYYFKGVYLYNTGVDPDHYPIKCTGSSALNMINITVMVDPGGCYGELANIRADNCSFRDGYFTEHLGSARRALEFFDCTLTGDMFVLTGDCGYRFVAFRGCDMYNGSLDFGSTTPGSDTKYVKFERVICQSDIKVNGDWDVDAYLSQMHKDGDFVIDTTGSVEFDKVLFPNGIHFLSNPTGTKSVVDCSFINNDIAPDHCDVLADVTVTDLVYSGNDQQNGICGLIQTTNTEKNVGRGSRDRYMDIQKAITSVPDGSTGIIRLWDDIIDVPEIIITHENTDININGQKKYSLTFAGDIVSVGPNRLFGFSDMKGLHGGDIELNGAGSEIGFESCQRVTGNLVLTNGVFAIVYKSSLFASTGHHAISVDNTSTIMVVGYSRIQGSTGNPAVMFTADADNKFKAKYSSFIHGDGGVNKPIEYLGVGKVDVAIYNSAMNAAMDPSKFHNIIGSPNNTVSEEIGF